MIRIGPGEARSDRIWGPFIALCAQCRFLFIIVLAFSGCHESPTTPDSPQRKTSESGKKLSTVGAIRRLGRSKGWELADERVAAELVSSPGDHELLKLAAEIKHHLNQPHDVADLLLEATQVDQYRDESLVDQAVIGLLAVGRLFEAIELLESCLEAYPDRHETRRWLFDSLVSSEQADRALPHGRNLVMRRKFDAVVLFSLSQTEQRDRELNSLSTLSSRNPEDRRLLIGEARILFDRGEFQKTEQLLAEMLQQHSDFDPAWMLLGQTLVASENFGEVATWASRVPEQSRNNWQYWSLVGDLAIHRGKFTAAAGSYWEAIQHNNGVGKVYAKLAMALQQSESTQVDEQTLDSLRQRAELLERLVQEKDRLYRSEFRSNQIMADVAETLLQLGRFWEAEAWVAHAITVPDQDVAVAKKTRAKIVQRLRADMPWQTIDEDFINRISRINLPPPNIDFASVQPGSESDEQISISDVPVLKLVSEERGLQDAPFMPLTVGDGVIPLHSQLGFGGAAVDFDCDGWVDLFLASGGHTPMSDTPNAGQLFRNQRGQFVPTGDRTGVHGLGFAQGVAVGDINEDGFADLVLLRYGRDQVFVNSGDGTFREDRDWIARPRNSWSTSGAIADIDLDGISDFVCLQYCAAEDPLNKRCYLPNSNTIDYCPPTHFDAEADQFFHGQAEGGWINANQDWNANPSNLGRGLGVIVGQLDGAEGIDIFVSNDMTSNHYWSVIGQDPIQLKETATIRGLALDERSRPQASMGIAVGDIDTDGDTDLVVTNFELEHNTFYEQTSPGIWRDKSRSRGLLESTFQPLGFGIQAVDFDNDAQPELVVANGHVHHDSKSGYAQQPQILRRLASGKFESISPEQLTGYFRERHVGRALWTLDFDRDHLLDLVVTHQRKSTALLQNVTPDARDNHWLRIRLVGTASARDAVGSIVYVSCGEVDRMAAVTSGDGFFCSSEDTLHFGFGPLSVEKEVQIEVRWPTGESQGYVANLDSECLIVEGDRDVFFYSDISP